MNLKLQAAGSALLAASLIASYAYAADKAPAPAKKAAVAKTAKKAKTAPAPTAAEQIQALRESLEKRIEKLEGNLAAKDVELKQAKQEASEAKAEAVKAQATAAAGNQAVSDNAAAVDKLQSSVKEIKGSTNALTAQVADVNAKSVKKGELSELAFGKVKLGGTFYGDYSYYTEAGVAPTFIDTANSNQPQGPNGVTFTTFNITRAYLNLTYTPNDIVSLRITPDIYRSGAATAVSSTTTAAFSQTQPTSGTYFACTSGSMSGYCSTLSTSNTYTTDGSLSYRLKYAYVDISKAFTNVKYISKSKITLGQMQNPWVDWEDTLMGHRYNYTGPWNFMGLSSTYVGIKAGGPIEYKGKMYGDYSVAGFNNAAYSSAETIDKKQFMGRLTAYPFGTKKDRTGFGITLFGNMGYSSSATVSSGWSYPIDRFAGAAFYQTEDGGYAFIGEYDLGHNSVSSSTLFPTSPVSTWTGNSTAKSAAGTLDASGTNPTRQQGFALQGRARLGNKKSPVHAFGLFQFFQPNTQSATAPDRYNFTRTVGGLAVSVNKNFDVSIGDSNFHWLGGQGTTGLYDTNAFSVWTQYNF